MAIKKPITSSACWLTSAFLMWGPAVAMVPGLAFACEQLRQPSVVSRTHNRKTLVVLLNRFSLLPSWFREGRGDAQTQQAATWAADLPTVTLCCWKKKSLQKYAIKADAASSTHNRDDSSSSAFLTKLKVTERMQEEFQVLKHLVIVKCIALHIF